MERFRTAKHLGYLSRYGTSAAVVALLIAAVPQLMPARASSPSQPLPQPSVEDSAPAGEQTAVLSGGCFWGVQGVYEHVKGVKNVLAGYSGGAQSTADYETVSSGSTGHAESVQIKYDPKVISYGQILKIYFSVVADPTELNRQGPDSGTQYRSEIFYGTDAQKKVAESYIAQLNAAKIFSKPIVTRVDALSGFYPAEDYHQDYLVRHPDAFYIQMNDLPKVEALKQQFPDLYNASPVMALPGGSAS